MSPNENNIAPAPKTVWEWLDSDLKSPLHRLYRLQSMLKALHLSLDSEHLSDGAGIGHIKSFAEFAFEESEHISGDMEVWLDKIKYLSPLKH